MKVYRVMARDNDEWDAEYNVVGICSTKEIAEEVGKHYCEVESQWGNYVYVVKEEVVDGYYTEFLSPLAKALS